MNYLALSAFAFILSLVPFSVAISTSIYRCIVWKEALKIAFTFAVFQAGMTALGWVIGFAVKGFLYSMAIPVAVLIIFLIGARLFFDSVRFVREQRIMAVENRRILLGFALVTSINSTLLGMGLGIIYKEILALIGFVFAMVFVMTILGILAGKRGMMTLGRTMESLGGIGLLVISVIIILQYLKIL